MSASAKVLTLENRTLNGDWTVVLPRRGRLRRHFPKIKTPEEQQMQWLPTDVEINPDRELKLILKMQIFTKKMERSQFYQTYLEQIHTPEVLDSFNRVLASDLEMQMVIYGIGSIDESQQETLND